MQRFKLAEHLKSNHYHLWGVFFIISVEKVVRGNAVQIPPNFPAKSLSI